MQDPDPHLLLTSIEICLPARPRGLLGLPGEWRGFVKETGGSCLRQRPLRSMQDRCGFPVGKNPRLKAFLTPPTGTSGHLPAAASLQTAAQAKRMEAGNRDARRSGQQHAGDSMHEAQEKASESSCRAPANGSDILSGTWP